MPLLPIDHRWQKSLATLIGSIDSEASPDSITEAKLACALYPSPMDK